MIAAIDLLRSDFTASASVFTVLLAVLSYVAHLAFSALAGGQ